MWIILIGFPNTNDFVNVSICKCDFKFTCHGYCRFTSSCCNTVIQSIKSHYPRTQFGFETKADRELEF